MAHSNPPLGARMSIPAVAGIGLRSQHYRDIVDSRPLVGWFEVHSENYFGKGGPPFHFLEKIRADYPISLHGVGMSLGSVDPLNRRHLAQLKALIERIQPALVSEHLSWNSFDGVYLNDLAPLPYTEETLAYITERVAQAQEYLGRQLLIENPSSYLEYRDSTLSESEFLAELARRSGCGILLDINNVYVSCCNHGWDAFEYLAAIPAGKVQEIHLAGHTVNQVAGRCILIDTHDRPVCAEVWTLYQHAMALIGPRPVLIEWDADLPDLSTLLEEARQADLLLETSHDRAA